MGETLADGVLFLKFLVRLMPLLQFFGRHESGDFIGIFLSLVDATSDGVTKPSEGLGIILGDGPTIFVEKTEVMLGLSVAGFRRFSDPD